MTQQISDSEFYMWRAIFALSHADDIVTDDEIRFMAEAMEDIPFSAEQQEILKDDIATPQDPVKMFTGVSDPKDQTNFFKFAQDMVMADGDFGKAEQEVMIKLRELHMRRTNVDDLVGEVKLEIEDDQAAEERSKKDVLFSFREQFLNGRAV